MATTKQVTEPANSAAANVTEPATVDPRRKVHVYDKNTGNKLDRPVPATFLDGRFPQLKAVPSKKKGQ